MNLTFNVLLGLYYFHNLKNTHHNFIFWLHWVFAAGRTFSRFYKQGLLFLVGLGFSLQWLLLFWSTGFGAQTCSCSTRAQ